MKKGYLCLDTGEVYAGAWRGGEPRAGEVVFNTSHSGYEEIATDPSYYSQIVLMTAPMQGNYGVDAKVWESRKMWIDGFVALQVQESERDTAWLKQLDQNQIPVLSDVDTRAITLRLRSGGTPWGALVPAETPEAAVEQARSLMIASKNKDRDWCWAVSRREVNELRGEKQGGARVAVLDFGCKENILRELRHRCSQVTVFPSRASVEEIMASSPDGILLSNGPGDPADVKVAVDTVRSLLGRLPIFGICMGNQILALALGGKTYKLRFGHRGSNHPIRDEILNSVYISSQNHGYAIERESLPMDIQVTQINLNDQTVAGIYSEKRRILGIQYHPESHPGPHDGVGLFDFFVYKMVGGGKRRS